MDNEIEIPKGVLDEEAYIESVKLSKHPIIRNPKYVTSEGVELNIAMMVHQLRKKIEHLPNTEREKIEKLKALYFKINNNLTIQKRKAFGKKQGPTTNGEDGGILESKKEELLEYFGRMFTTEEVLKIVNLDWGFPIGKQTVYEFKLKYAEDIKKRIEHHQVSYHNIRLGIKKSRLEELSELYVKAKSIYTDGSKREDLKVLLSILEQLRKEAEGDRLTIDGKVDIKYEQNIQVHLMKEVFATTNLKEIILGRVAAKMGVNPVKLIYSLQNSYYKQYSNVLGDFDDDEANKDLPYPSQLNYDFERIGKNFLLQDKHVQDAVIEEEQSNESDLSKGQSLKDILAARLKQKNEDINKFKSKLEIYEEQNQKPKTKK
jgi:hypothetical protein